MSISASRSILSLIVAIGLLVSAVGTATPAGAADSPERLEAASTAEACFEEYETKNL